MLRPVLLRCGHASASSNLPGLLCPSCVEQLCVLHALPRSCTASGATYVCSICALLIRIFVSGVPFATGTQHQTSSV